MRSVKTSYTEAIIQAKLWWEMEQYRGHRPVVPNVFMPNWYECDCVSVTKASAWYEFEIKITRADFKNDARKETRTHRHTLPDRKYDALHDGVAHGPARFIYVTPPGLLTASDIPAFAGLWEVGHGVRLREIVPAPKLKSDKLTEAGIAKLYQTMYWRYWRLAKKHHDI